MKSPWRLTSVLSCLVAASASAADSAALGVETDESEAARLELTLYPVVFQLNGVAAEHWGSSVGIAYRLHPKVSLRVTGGYNWHSDESAFHSELLNTFGVAEQPSKSLTWSWMALGGVEVTPLRGNLPLWRGLSGQLSFVVSADVGAGGSREMIRPSYTFLGESHPALFADTGLRLMGAVGAGLRFQLGSRMAVRLEVRDVFFAAQSERIAGCDIDDLSALRHDPGDRGVSGSCDRDALDGATDLAMYAARFQPEGLAHNLGLYTGISVLF